MADNAELRLLVKAEVDAAIQAFGKLDDKLKKTSKSINQGSAAATDFTRVIQDAPFGIIGIGNNITQLADSFGRLRTETKSTGGAFKALGQSLIGPGGIGFAISAIITAVTFAQIGLQNWTRKTKEAKEKQDEWAKAQHNTRVEIEKSRIEVENLVKVARGDIGSKKDQIIALEKLNQLIPDNIGVLTQQNIKTQEGIGIVTSYVGALQAQATAQLLVQKTAELSANNIEAEIKQREQLIPMLTELASLKSQLAKPDKPTFAAGTTGVVQQASEHEQIQARINFLTREINKINKDTTGIIDENNKKLNEYNLIINKNLVAANKLNEIQKKPPPPPPPPDFNLDPSTFKTQLIPLQQILNEFLKGGVQPGQKMGLQIITPEVLENAKEAQALFKEQQAQWTAIASTLSNEVAGAFGEVFDAATKGEDVFKALTDAVKKLILNLVKAVAQALILEAIASAFGLPGGGTFLNGIFSGGMAVGGVRGGGVSSGPALVAVGTLRGQDILLSVQRTERSNFLNG